MQKRKTILLLTMVLFSTSAFSLMQINTVAACKKPDFGFSFWIETNNQKYLRVYATDHYQLGLEMGQGLIEQIYILDSILKSIAAMSNISIDFVTGLMTLYDTSIPEDYKLFIQGISDSTGLSYYDVMFQVTWMDVYYGILVPMSIQSAMEQIAGCSAFGSDNTVGQTYDLWAIMLPTLAFVKYTLLTPRPTTVFSLWQGAFCYPIGKNHRDVMMVTNLIQNIIPGDFGTPTSIKSMMAFETARNTDECLNIMLSSFPGGYNYIITDRRGNGMAVQTIQVNPYLSENVDIQEIINTKVRTNTYLRPDFFNFLIDPTYAIARQTKGEELSNVAYEDDQNLSTEELIDLMQYNDGTDASINRYPVDLLEPATLGYISMDKHCIKFGIGLVSDEYGFIWM